MTVIPLSSDNLSQFRKNLFWIWVLGRKPKQSVTIWKKQNKAQYDLDRQTAKISDLSPGNVSQYESLILRYFPWRKLDTKSFENRKI